MSDKHALVNGKAKYVRIFIRRKRIGTNKGLAERLINAGVPLNTADLSVDAKTGTVHTDHTLFQKQPEAFLPAWSVIALMELLPIALEGKDGTEFRLLLMPYGTAADMKWYIAYADQDTEAASFEGFLLDALVSMVEYVYNISEHHH